MNIGNLFQTFIQENMSRLEGTEMHDIIQINLKKVEKNKSNQPQNQKKLDTQKVMKNGVEKEIEINIAVNSEVATMLKLLVSKE